MTAKPLPDDVFDDPTGEIPYPEFDGEVFEMYRDDGITPEQLHGSEAVAYAKWLYDNPAD